MSNESVNEWNAIAKAHGSRVCQIALRILGSVHDAEDIAQDVFVEAFELFQQQQVRSWPGLLVRLATLRSIDRLRRRRSSVELPEDGRITHVSPQDEVELNELMERLQKSIAHLPPRQAAVFTLISFEQLSRDEVAKALDISPEAVSTALCKARHRLSLDLNVLNTGEY